MRSVKLTGIDKMDFFEEENPELINEDDVIIRIRSVGVCGSDVHYYNTGRIGSQIVKYPFTVGHECSGVVESAGKGVKALRVGDRVAVDPAMPCYKCDQCLQGRYHTCRNLKFLGCPGQSEGCLSEFIRMPEKSCVKIDDKISLDEAALSEPLSIGYYACRLSESGLEGKKIGILGFGPIGISVYLAAKALGADIFFVTDKLGYRLESAKNAGINLVANPLSENIEDFLLSNIPEALDIVFECCGQQDAVYNAMNILKPGGKLMMVGIPEVDEISFPMDKMRRKELSVQNVRRQNECVEPSLDLIADNLVDVNFMHTHTFSFEKTPDAFKLVSNYEDKVIKAIVEF